MSAAVIVLPPREPDAVRREAENLRRARTVFASGPWPGGAVFHAATLGRVSSSVIQKPNHQIRRAGQ